MLSNNQIVKLYENSGLSPEQIAEVFPDLNVDAIRMALAGSSGKFMKEVAKKNGTEILNMEVACVVMNELVTDEDPNVRYKAAKYVINEKQGRHDVKNLKGHNININVINDRLVRAKQLGDKFLEIEAEVVGA